MNKHTRSVSLIDGHIEGMTDAEVIKALECCSNDGGKNDCLACPNLKSTENWECKEDLPTVALALINRQQAEIETLKNDVDFLDKHNDELINENERLRPFGTQVEVSKKLEAEIKSEAIKELSEKITEIFMRYAHLHSYAEGARKDYIETVDGKEIEMQSVWDVITLQMNGIAEYEEMSRLQKNIEIIEKDRLLTELEKDFRLLVKEMTEVSE